MAYPTFTQLAESTCELLDKVEVDRASNGAPRGRATFTAPRRRFVVKHVLHSAADVATLLAFYAANRLATFDFVWAEDGETYSCIFAQGGAPKWGFHGGDNWPIEVVLET